MQRYFLNDLVGQIDLWPCDEAEFLDLGGKYAPALPAAVSADRRIQPTLGTLQALRGIAAITGQRIVSITIRALMQWQGLESTETNRRKIRWDLLRLAKCGVLDRGVRESDQGRTLAIAVRLKSSLFLESRELPESKHGMVEMMPVPHDEAVLPPSFEGGEISPPISYSEAYADASRSEFDNPYPDASDSAGHLPAIDSKGHVVVVGPVEMKHRTRNVLKKLTNSQPQNVDNAVRLTGKQYDAYRDRLELEERRRRKRRRDTDNDLE
jgi:hypothetical protein